MAAGAAATMVIVRGVSVPRHRGVRLLLVVLAALAAPACSKKSSRNVSSIQPGMGLSWGGGGGVDSPLTDPVATFLEEIKSPSLRAPVRIAVGGPRQRIVVSDADARAVHVFTRTGVLRFSIPVNQPLGVAVDPQGQMFVGDQTTGAVRVYDETGKLLRLLGAGIGQFKQPSDIARDPSSGLIHVVDSQLESVFVYDAQGGYRSSYGSSGTGNGQLSFPSSITIDAVGNAYIADFSNTRLQIFSSIDGGWKKTFGTYGAGKTQFARPSGLAIDSQNRIYVTDTLTNILQVVDGNGLHVSWIGQSGTWKGQLSLPIDTVLDSYSRLLVTSSRTNKIVVYGIDNYQQPKAEEAVPATVVLEPSKINSRSSGRWITAYIEIPGGDAHDIVVSSVRLKDVAPDPAAPTSVGDADGDGIPDLMVKFLRAQVLLALGQPGRYTLTLSADLKSGEYAEGEVTLEVSGAGTE